MTGFAIVVFWLVATAWLVWKDIVPAWTAQDPPKIVASDWVRQYGRRAQFGIFDSRGRRVGSVWTHYAGGVSSEREDEIYLNGLPLLGPTPIYIDIRSKFNMEGMLDEIDIALLGFWDPIRIHGERFHSQFALGIDRGAAKNVIKIDLNLAGTFSDAFRPFDAMPNLFVGRSWRMQVFNPIAAVTGIGAEFIPMVVRVVRREVIQVDGRPRDCFVVETTNARAWVERSSGVVLVQEVTLPVGGTYTVRYETYDDAALRAADERFKRFRDEL